MNSRSLAISVFDTSGKDLLQGSELVDVNADDTLYDVLDGLSEVTDRELKSVNSVARV